MTAGRPCFSLALATPDPETIASLRGHGYRDWELLLPADPGIDDPRIRTTPDPLADALGTWFVPLTYGDRLRRGALGAVSRAAATTGVDLVYTDEQRDGTALRKPDWSPERLRHGDYLGGLRAYRTAAAREAGGYRAEFGSAAEYDLTLRVTERAQQVVHVPDVLVDRVEPAAIDPERARAAAQQHLDRLGIAGTVEPGPVPEYARIVRRLDPDVRVSLLLPTRGTSGEAWGRERCFAVEAVRTALAKTRHSHIEVVVIYDEATPAEVLDELRVVAGARLVTVRYDKPFNFSEKINLAFLHSTGDVVVLFNDDLEACSDGWLETLTAPLAEPDVGMTGARLIFPDGRVQHGGHFYGDGGSMPRLREAYRNRPGDLSGELGSLVISRETSGVTGAVAALRREVFEQIGGLTECLPVNFNDVDLSLKVRDAGFRVLWMADCVLYHFESQTRDTKVRPFEYEFIAKRWGLFRRDAYLPWLRG